MRKYTKEQKFAYRNFLPDNKFPFCWCCGRYASEQPSWYNAPMLIERAHCVNKPRIEDVRVIILACSLCHSVSHGFKYKQCPMPKIDVAAMLWLKLHFDPELYDLEFMQKFSIRILPEPEEAPKEYQQEFLRRHGAYPFKF